MEEKKKERKRETKNDNQQIKMTKCLRFIMRSLRPYLYKQRVCVLLCMRERDRASSHTFYTYVYV